MSGRFGWALRGGGLSVFFLFKRPFKRKLVKESRPHFRLERGISRMESASFPGMLHVKDQSFIA